MTNNNDAFVCRPPPQENIPDPVQLVNQPVEAVPQAPPAPPARERQENPAQNQNMVMNANAGGGMMQGEDEEENGQRDWLDYVYMAVRISMLMSIFWFYSSAERLIIMGLVVLIIWLVQSGVFNLNRAPINRQQGKYLSLFLQTRLNFNLGKKGKKVKKNNPLSTLKDNFTINRKVALAEQHILIF